MREVLDRLFKYQTLDQTTSKEILTKLANGEYTPSQMAAFLTVFMMRESTVSELTGFRDAMLDLCIKVPSDDYNAIDLCGTGGDGKDTFNISTISSFVVAGAGQIVAKHGNYGVSSVCGSSNVLEYLGCTFTNDLDMLTRSFESAGIAFMHAPLFHPAMKNVGPIRRELGVKTFFNMLGPMVNPAFPKNQLVGVFNLELARLYGYLYQETDKNFVILHALDGYDEISLTGGIKYISNKEEGVLAPGDLGFDKIKAESLAGGKTVEASAKIFESILSGNGTDQQNSVVIANAGMGIATGKDISFLDGVEEARESLKNGSALKSFKKFLEVNGN